RPARAGEDCGPGAPRVEPDVEDVGLLLELRAVALRTARPAREQLGERLVEPGVGAVLLEDARHVLHRLGRDERLAVLDAVRDRDGHSPAPLPRDAPVGPVLHHSANPLLAPGGNPATSRRDAVDAFDRRLPGRGSADVPVLPDPQLAVGP